ncbi:TcpQ domain-containing protein [Pantoea cypripedii]|uniref:Toxin co-regulated pilus biosynthesis protein Q C-terminal domain-containing protein n=1 Tax=Pantoea cypripedii TaxID=55209 RepID=A0A1X1EN41_PANCY|nr:TcpQ domain-containing protein [Pantoea cypripedii]MBP2199316.1 hypothetical protein [Pantoea cypripedii]ORM90184.1 hypothetical protein HA50_26950 [Pantoea cypripedii]
MQIRYFSLLLPVLLAGCDSLSARPREPVTPALVFIDGQISDSTEVIAQTQRRIAPAITAPRPQPVTPVQATVAPVSHPASVSQPLPSPVISNALSALVMTGSVPSVPVVSVPLIRNQTTGQVVRRLLPADWQLRQENAATPALNTRLVSWSSNDQWHRSLNRLLQEQHLYGHLDWNQKILTITTTAAVPGTQAPPPALRPVATAPMVNARPSMPVPVTSPANTAPTPKNPFRENTAAPAATSPVKNPASRLVMTGQAPGEPVIFLSADNLTTEQWVMRMTPAGWTTSWSGVPKSARSSRVRNFGVNDQWYRGLDNLLNRQNLWGHLNWNTRTLVISPSAAAPVVTPVIPLPPATPHPLTGTATPGVTPPSSATASPPQVWVAEKGNMLHQTITLWAAKAVCDVPGQGPHWNVVWTTPVDYSIDVRFEKTGTWQEALDQTFALYQSARTPLYSTLYPKQCLVGVTDKAP